MEEEEVENVPQPPMKRERRGPSSLTKAETKEVNVNEDNDDNENEEENTPTRRGRPKKPRTFFGILSQKVLSVLTVNNLIIVLLATLALILGTFTFRNQQGHSVCHSLNSTYVGTKGESIYCATEEAVIVVGTDISTVGRTSISE